jgi:hypothetical protein
LLPKILRKATSFFTSANFIIQQFVAKIQKKRVENNTLFAQSSKSQQAPFVSNHPIGQRVV